MYAMLTGKLPFVPSSSNTNLTSLQMMIMKGVDIPKWISQGIVFTLNQWSGVVVAQWLQKKTLGLAFKPYWPREVSLSKNLP